MIFIDFKGIDHIAEHYRYVIMRLITIILLLLVFKLSDAQTASAISYEALCNAKLRSSSIDAHISIIDSGEIVFQQAYGYKSSPEYRDDSLAAYPIGSISKTYTATLVLKAIQNKRFDLHSTIDHWVSDMPMSNEITIASLLYHQSGLSDQNYFKWKYAGKKLRMIKGSEYANCNYGILGLILEKEYGRPLADILNDSLLTPLGLEHTFADSISSIHAPPNAIPDLDWKQALNDAGGAGNLSATSSDVAYFLHQLFNTTYLNKNSLELFRKFKQGYGPGTFPAPYKNILGITNSGQFGKYTSTLIYFPDQKFGISILCSKSERQTIDSLLLEIVKLRME